MPDDKTTSTMSPSGREKTSKASKKPRYRWICALPAQQIGNFLFLPLTSTKELASEGRSMRNCVAQYDEICAIGVYQVFSVRDLNGKHLATLGVIFDECGWKIDQCLGRKNADVTTGASLIFDADDGHHEIEEPNDLHYAALELVRQYAKASEIQVSQQPRQWA